jgi:GT2 family glycosyltransferase
VSIAAIVLNWNGWEDTAACVSGLLASGEKVTPVIVDNGSSDGSVRQLRARFPDVLVLEVGANLGYAGGNNRGLDYALEAGFEFVCVINNDTVVPPSLMGSLKADVHGSDRAVSPTIHRVDSGEVWFAGAEPWNTLALPGHRLQRAPDGATTYLTGCCVFAHRDVWRRVGGFDERYFLVFEDSEWSVRAVARDVELFVSASTLGHKVSASLGSRSDLGSYYWTRNAIWFLRTTRAQGLWGPVWELVLRPSLAELRAGQSGAIRRCKIRLLALQHAVRGRMGGASGWHAARWGLTP